MSFYFSLCMHIMIPFTYSVLKLVKVLWLDIEVRSGDTDVGQSVVLARVDWTISLLWNLAPSFATILLLMYYEMLPIIYILAIW